jgi:hypothetical protein
MDDAGGTRDAVEEAMRIDLTSDNWWDESVDNLHVDPEAEDATPTPSEVGGVRIEAVDYDSQEDVTYSVSNVEEPEDTEDEDENQEVEDLAEITVEELDSENEEDDDEEDRAEQDFFDQLDDEQEEHEPEEKAEEDQDSDLRKLEHEDSVPLIVMVSPETYGLTKWLIFDLGDEMVARRLILRDRNQDQEDGNQESGDKKKDNGDKDSVSARKPNVNFCQWFTGLASLSAVCVACWVAHASA